jgi:hypothetical protein
MLMEKVGFKEAVYRELFSMMGLDKMEEYPVENQVAKLVESIQ